jgi:hypothetical protein
MKDVREEATFVESESFEIIGADAIVVGGGGEGENDSAGTIELLVFAAGALFASAFTVYVRTDV